MTALFSLQIHVVNLFSANVATWSALPQNRIQMLIGYSFCQTILYYKNYSKLNLYSRKNKHKFKFAVVYEAGIMAGLASITPAP